METGMDAESLAMLEDTLRKTMLSASGAELDAALAELGWAEMLSDMPDQAIPLVFRLLGKPVRTLRFSTMCCWRPLAACREVRHPCRSPGAVGWCGNARRTTNPRWVICRCARCPTVS